MNETTQDSHYIHGTSNSEQARLTLTNNLLNARSLGEANIRAGDKILDLGSGLGQLSCLMAQSGQPGGIVVGIERSKDQIKAALELAKKQEVERIVQFREGDVHTMPLTQGEWGSFDVAHARFLLEHIPDPQNVVQSMIKAVKKSGRIILEDDDHDIVRLWPEPSGFGKLWDAYMRSYECLGNNPRIGRSLISLLKNGGANPVRNTWIWFGSCSGDVTFGSTVDNLIGVIVGAKEVMLDQGLIRHREFDEGMASLMKWKNRGDAAYWYAAAWAEGVKADL